MKTFEQVINDQPIDSISDLRRTYRTVVNDYQNRLLGELKFKYEGKIVTFNGYGPRGYGQKVILRKLVNEVIFNRGDNNYVLGFAFRCDGDGRMIRTLDKIYNVEEPTEEELDPTPIVIPPKVKKEKKVIVPKQKEVFEHDPFDEEVDAWNPKSETKKLPHLFLNPGFGVSKKK